MTQEKKVELPLYCFPSIVHVSDFAKEIPFPHLVEPDARKKYNLSHDSQNSKDVYRMLNSNEEAVVETIYNLMVKGNVDFLKFNSTTPGLLQADLKKTQENSSLLNALVSYAEAKQQDITSTVGTTLQPSAMEIDEATPQYPVLPQDITKTTTPIRSRKDRIKVVKKKQVASPKVQIECEPGIKAGELVVALKKEAERLEDILQEILILNEEDILSEQLVKQLRTEVKIADKQKFIDQFSTEQFIRVLGVLDLQISRGQGLLSQESALEHISENKLAFKVAIESALTALTIMVSSSQSKEIMVEEVLQNIFDFMKLVLKNFVYPTVELAESEKPKRGKKPAASVVSCKQEQVLLCTMFDTLLKLLRKTKLKNEFLLAASDAALSTFFVEGVDGMQLHALNIVTEIFSRFVELRPDILKEIILSVLKLPSGKRSNKAYKLQDRKSIQTFTALMLQLVQSCALLPVESESKEQEQTESNEELASHEKLIKDCYEASKICMIKFADYFLERCTTSESVDGDNRNIVEHFVDDLLVLLDNPEWPAVDVMLIVMAKSICVKYVTDKKYADKFRAMGLDILGRILSKCKEYESTVNKTSAKDDDSDDEDVVDPFANIKQELSKSKEWNFVKDLDVNYQAIYLYLQAKVDGNAIAGHARQFLLSQWLSENPQLSTSTLTCMWNKSLKTPVSTAIKLNDASKAYLKIACTRKESILKNCDSLLVQVLDALKDDKATVRKSALRAIKDVIVIDASMLNKSFLHQAITQRCHDERIAVRESVVELIGTAMIDDKKFVPYFKTIVFDRIKDTGVSVRKRCIHILEKLCASMTDDKTITEICVVIASRLNPNNNEEESVKNLVIKVFDNLWFNSNKHGDKNTALQIIDVVAQKDIDFSQAKNNWLVQLIKKNISNNDNRPTTAISKLAEHLFDLVMDLDTAPVVNATGRNSIIHAVETLRLFAIGCSQAIATHVTRLAVYLDPAELDKKGCQFVEHIASMLDLCMPSINKPDPKFVTTARSHLLKLIYSTIGTTFEVYQSCVRCLCSLHKKANEEKTLSTIAVKMLGSVKQNVSRILPSLGMFCLLANVEMPATDEKKRETFAQKVFQWAIAYAESDQVNDQAAAVQALSYIIIKNPKVASEKVTMKAITSALQRNSVEVNRHVLILLRDFILAEENNLESVKEKKAEASAQDIGQNANIVSNFVEGVLLQFRSPDHAVRNTALTVIELVIKHGLYIPQCISPYTIALEADPVPEIREQAHLLNQAIESRHTATKPKAADGVLLSFELLSEINGKNKNIPGFFEISKTKVSRFARFYAAFKLNKRERTKMFDSLVKKIQSNIYLTQYICHAIAYLPYSTQEEAVYVISKLGTIIDENAEEIRQNLKEAVSENQKTSEWASKAVIMHMLMLTKQYLQESCGIRTKRYKEYSESSPSKSFEKKITLRQAETSLNFADIIAYFESLDGEKLKLLYKEYKRLWESHMEFDVISGATNESSPPKQRGRKPKTSPPKKKATGKKRKREEEEEAEEEEPSEDEYVAPSSSKSAPTKGATHTRKRQRVITDDEEEEENE